MSRSLRYSNPEVCDQLAAQYVAGDMTARVRRRMEQLMREHPPLKVAVADWSDRMLPLHNRYPEQAPPADIWHQIERSLPVDRQQATASSKLSTASTQRPGALSRLLDVFNPSVWWPAVMGGAVVALVMVTLNMGLFQSPGTVGPAYMAPLSWEGDVALVVSGYRSDGDQPAWVSAQWSARLDDRPEGATHLWAETGDNREWVYLGAITEENRRWDLDPERWQAVMEAHRLVVNDNPGVIQPQLAILEGPCIQLGSWDTTEI
ncbi:hypothetical protein [Saccharospirillum impatiens]|uniref:hypothetical protein n=1 Tax=Saccharospirillum impatiens TaxID=169438 RepID=UPI0003FA986D|nr:hypothetical protein [Saccharospirillum impatiens]